MPNQMRFVFSGRLRIRIRALLIMLWSGVYVALRRMLRGPLLPSWGLQFEASTLFQKTIVRTAFGFTNVGDGRELVDAIVLQVPALEKVTLESLSTPVPGTWFRPESGKKDRVILYCHGAYAFYAKGEQCLIANIAVVTGLSVFALDYRLVPENPFPAQLNDALAAYDWLRELGYRGRDIILMGTSAGGNLCLSLIQSIRDSNRPAPRQVIGICPWTDVGNSGKSIDGNERFDTLDRYMVEQGARWLIGDYSPKNPLLSPLHADLRGLPPIYLQAGGREIFIDMIRAFYKNAQEQGTRVELEVWEPMNHVFQAYVDLLPEAGEAMQRIAAIAHQDETLPDLAGRQHF